MIIRTMDRVALICRVAASLALVPASVDAQTMVYDPSNYAQNVLQAARSLQQINNQITSLQNQTQMRLNQAKNLARLPYGIRPTAKEAMSSLDGSAR